MINSKYSLSDDEIQEIKNIVNESVHIKLEIDENHDEDFDEKIIIDNMNDEVFHKKFKDKLDELNKKYSKK